MNVREAYELLTRLFVVMLLVLLISPVIRLEYMDSTAFLITNRVPDEINIRTDRGEKIIRDAKLINSLHGEIMYKAAKRMDGYPKRDRVLSLEYGYKGKDLVIDDEGRVFILIYKSEVRNRSGLGWIWWKIDSKFGSPYSFVTYVIEPNPRVLELAKQIKHKINS